jgi:hypothetical protein
LVSETGALDEGRQRTGGWSGSAGDRQTTGERRVRPAAQPPVVERHKSGVMNANFSNLKRPKYSMPSFVREALERRGLMAAYEERPAYQQNDYIGWISRAQRQETKQKKTSANAGCAGAWWFLHEHEVSAIVKEMSMSVKIRVAAWHAYLAKMPPDPRCSGSPNRYAVWLPSARFACSGAAQRERPTNSNQRTVPNPLHGL